MGLGSLQFVDVTAARALRDEARKQIHDGLDPINERRRERAKAAVQAQPNVTFAAFAEQHADALGPKARRWRPSGCG